MLNPLSLRKAISLVVVLLTCLCLTGCYSMRTVSMNGLPEKISLFRIHADDNYWTVSEHSVTDGILTAKLSAESVKVRNNKVVNIYVAPQSSVTIAGDILTVPAANIGKIDYNRFDIWETLGLLAVIGSLVFMFTGL